LAHTADDRAETLLLNLARGTGPKGLAAPREHQGRILRPLLALHRHELTAYVRSLGWTWCVDTSNWNVDYRRNWVRHRLIPQLETGLNPQIRRHLAELAGRMARWSADLDRRTAAELARRQAWEGDTLVLTGLDPAELDEWLLAELIRAAHRRVGPSEPGLTEAHIQICLDLLRGESGRAAHLPGGIWVERTAGELRFGPEPDPPRPLEPLPLEEGAIRDLPGCRISLRQIPLEDAVRELAHRREAAREDRAAPVRDRELFDRDRLHPPLWTRTWRAGDRLRPLGMRGGKLVSDLLGEARIRQSVRSRIPVVGDREGLIWVAGIRRSQRAPVTPSTRRVVELRYEPVA
ncbi:MAG: tRNA lysidine(34) synthetase TilS, partial [Candidatus Eisenbacteria bacterium]|nr:tRNA lysidine(34) synthetase TilS [Candidatus Eisenbacteria bacterium]